MEIAKYKSTVDDDYVDVAIIQEPKGNRVEVIRVSRLGDRDINNVAGFWVNNSELKRETIEAGNGVTITNEEKPIEVKPVDDDLEGRLMRMMNLSGEFDNPKKAEAYTNQIINTVEAWLKRDLNE